MIDPVKNYQRAILKKARVELKSSDKVLDLGCGRGDNARIFAQKAKKSVGVDIKKWSDWDKLASEKLKFIEADAHKLPFADHSFEVVFAKDMLHHVKRPEIVLKEIHRVLKKGGRVFLVEYNRYNPIGFFHLVKFGEHDHFSTRKFKQLVKKEYPEAKFHFAECRVYPFLKTIFLEKIVTFYEKVFEAVPVLNNFACYNIAIFKNGQKEKIK